HGGIIFDDDNLQRGQGGCHAIRHDLFLRMEEPALRRLLFELHAPLLAKPMPRPSSTQRSRGKWIGSQGIWHFSVRGSARCYSIKNPPADAREKRPRPQEFHPRPRATARLRRVLPAVEACTTHPSPCLGRGVSGSTTSMWRPPSGRLPAFSRPPCRSASLRTS